jgi:hypothetical protein
MGEQRNTPTALTRKTSIGGLNKLVSQRVTSQHVCDDHRVVVDGVSLGAH